MKNPCAESFHGWFRDEFFNAEVVSIAPEIQPRAAA